MKASGLGSAGIRFNESVNRTVTKSQSRKDAFRNRLRNTSIMSSTAVMGNAKSGDKENSSVSSRFVMKLDNLQMESDIIS